MKKEAGKVGANGVILDALSEPGSGAKVAAAIFGVSAQRKGKALAIWVFPADAPIAAQAATAPPQTMPTHSPTAISSASGIRPFSYAGEPAQVAKTALSKAKCSDGFALVSDADGRKIYEAICISGKRQLLECWSGACRTLN
jgi:hypothetical protein